MTTANQPSLSNNAVVINGDPWAPPWLWPGVAWHVPPPQWPPYDAEADAIADVARIMSALGEDARARVLAYLESRYGAKERER